MNIIYHKEPELIFLYLIHKAMYGNNKRFLVLYDTNLSIMRFKKLLAKCYNILRDECEIFNPCMINNTLSFDNYIMRSTSKIFFRGIDEIRNLNMCKVKLNTVVATSALESLENRDVLISLSTIVYSDGKIVVI